MGYNTRYSLSWENGNQFVKQCRHEVPDNALYCPTCGKAVREFTLSSVIGDYIEDHEEIYGIDRYGTSIGDYTWYSHEDNIKAISLEFPDVLFTLHGEGEEFGDIWNKYFLNGKMQMAKAEIIIPEFDKDKLK